MKVIKAATVVFLMLTITHQAVAKSKGDDFLNTESVDRANQYVVAPGTRVVAGNPLEDEFYILGAEPRKVAAERPVVKMAAHKPPTRTAAVHLKTTHKPSIHAVANQFKKHKKASVAMNVKPVKAKAIKTKTRIAVNRDGHNHIEVTG